MLPTALHTSSRAPHLRPSAALLCTRRPRTQDTASRSWVVRAYYRHRLFMGFCCICCEVLYLALYCLTWPQYRRGGLALPPALAGRTLAAGEAGRRGGGQPGGWGWGLVAPPGVPPTTAAPPVHHRPGSRLAAYWLV